MPLLNRLINTLSAVLDPEAIVFGGQAPPPLARMLIARAQFWGRHRYGIGMARPELLLSEVAGDAAAAGAAMLPLREVVTSEARRQHANQANPTARRHGRRPDRRNDDHESARRPFGGGRWRTRQGVTPFPMPWSDVRLC
ncbi:hypothetical protein [Chthonobacter rhizosphaerae]|uniref:hypothetical protein n=1 Tax=Chthonobacter rhizosphaerae TaxID=2735553 RepID=UPI0015EF5572|nr:hypothetical protein [Chthonobacter rhizosphaerae]